MDFHSELQEEGVQCLPVTDPGLELHEIDALSNCGSLKEIFVDLPTPKTYTFYTIFLHLKS